MKEKRKMGARSKASKAKVLLAASGLVFASGCATDPRTGQPSFKETFASDNPCSDNARNIGIGTGAVLGAVIGNQFKHSNNARLLGAFIGAAAGGMIGHDMDSRRCALAKIAKQYNVDISQANIDDDGQVIGDAASRRNRDGREEGAKPAGTVIQVSELAGGHFESNSDRLTPRAQEYFSAIADAYNDRIRANGISDPQARAEYIAAISKRKILLVGHTDDTGSSKLNADLSERRARTVSDFMAARGIPRASLYFQGAGEVFPIADNATEEGRAANRRVEIVEIADQAGFDRYLSARKPRYDLYRPTDVAPEHELAVTKTERTAHPVPVKGPTVVAASRGTHQRSAAGGKNAPGASAKPVLPQPAPSTAGNELDFGGVPFAASVAKLDVGAIERKPSYFSLISPAYADEPAVIHDCMHDRPRVAGSVKALSDGKTYRTSEYFPGLYGKTWTEQINGHQVVINKVAVLANDGSLANPPEFKVYANYDARKNANPPPAVQMSPQVNAYLGTKGVLYRMFLQGNNGLQCADIVFANEGGTMAKAGKLVYTRRGALYMTEFKPKMYKTGI